MRIDGAEIQGIVRHFEEIDDPRSEVNRRHLLVDVIVISILGVIAGADGPLAIALWAKMQEPWIREHLALPNGIPSRHTIGRVLQSLKPLAFQQCFAAWLASLHESPSGVEPEEQEKQLRQIALDGKCLRRSHARGRGLGAMYLVSAWATDKGIALGQLAVEEKSNEITAIPQLLDQLDLTNAVVTIDAAGCQRNIVDEIVAGGGEYMVALKGNQETLHRDVTGLFATLLQEDFVDTPVSRYEERDESHGRVEERNYYQISVPTDFPQREKWTGLKTFGLAIRRCVSNGKETLEHRYYISSLSRHGRRFANCVRGHWSIENKLHWVLDMTFREDESRVRERCLADNLGWLRRLALTLLKQHPGTQSIAMKRRMSGWSVDFLMQVLMGTTT
jgi:predicted transposase YbfD/YdcC